MEGSEGCSRSLAERVVRAVAAHTDSDPLELPPLYGAIDPDVLDAGVRGASESELSFRYAGRVVTARGDGTVDVSEEPAAGVERTGSAADD